MIVPATALQPPYDGFRSAVRPEWTDANKHFNSVRYMDVFREAFIQFLGAVNLSVRQHPGAGTMFQAEAHVRYQRELLEGAPIAVRSWLVAADAKRLHHVHEMYHAEAGYRAATAEYLHLHIALDTRRVGPMPPGLQERAQALLAAQQRPPADAVGRRIRLGAGGSAAVL